MGWNHKSEAAGWLLLFAIPIIAAMMAVFVPFIHNYPVLFWVVVIGLFVLGFIFVCKRAGKKQKKELSDRPERPE